MKDDVVKITFQTTRLRSEIMNEAAKIAGVSRTALLNMAITRLILAEFPDVVQDVKAAQDVKK